MAPDAVTRDSAAAAPGSLALAEAIDLRQPWLAPWTPWLQPILEALRDGASVAEALNQTLSGLGAGHSAQGMRFVPQSHLPASEAYEAFIFRTGCVPTRDNLHDLLNGACWLRFAAIKRRLNSLQAEQIATSGVGATRGPVRDALTLLDENAMLLCGPARLRDAHRVHDWQTMFVRERNLWAQTHVVAFGHALLENLLQPYKSITAHVLWVDLPAWGEGTNPVALDTAMEQPLVAQLTAPWLATKPFLPLPVLGLPGWWADNEQPGFYDDVGVFRPKIDKNDFKDTHQLLK
ncbi:MAG: DUF3025 domain-containing protein [Alphaproteobacteria bacterium]|nr:DUF3025 domain-containing protein [Alphaproteobacteria bacterium]MDI9329922.1 DUF3025 domain-containing protein [Alphaproteobacteria bacterium]